MVNLFVLLQLHCCGIRDPRDWSQQGYTSLPQSCCREVQPGQVMS